MVNEPKEEVVETEGEEEAVATEGEPASEPALSTEKTEK